MDLNTVLILLANIIAGLVLAQITDLKRQLIETHVKLDRHVENYELHGLTHPKSAA